MKAALATRDLFQAGLTAKGYGRISTEIKPAPEFSAALETQFITGLGTIEERMLILLDIERLMTSKDMQLVESATDVATH